MGMTNSQLDGLDQIAEEVLQGRADAFGVLSTGEKLYVALAANSSALLDRAGYTMVEAISRLGEEDTQALVERWRRRD